MDPSHEMRDICSRCASAEALARCDREQAAAAASTGVGAAIGFADWGAEKIELLRAAEAL